MHKGVRVTISAEVEARYAGGIAALIDLLESPDPEYTGQYDFLVALDYWLYELDDKSSDDDLEDVLKQLEDVAAKVVVLGERVKRWAWNTKASPEYEKWAQKWKDDVWDWVLTNHVRGKVVGPLVRAAGLDSQGVPYYPEILGRDLHDVLPLIASGEIKLRHIGDFRREQIRKALEGEI